MFFNLSSIKCHMTEKHAGVRFSLFFKCGSFLVVIHFDPPQSWPVSPWQMLFHASASLQSAILYPNSWALWFTSFCLVEHYSEASLHNAGGTLCHGHCRVWGNEPPWPLNVSYSTPFHGFLCHIILLEKKKLQRDAIDRKVVHHWSVVDKTCISICCPLRKQPPYHWAETALHHSELRPSTCEKLITVTIISHSNTCCPPMVMLQF